MSYPETPACWSWDVPPQATRESELERMISEWAEVPLSKRPRNDVLEMSLLAWPMGVMLRWHDGRCAVCGGGGHLVQDHDHWTGLTRGYLCRSCNVREGARTTVGHPLFDAYRERHPALILGLRFYYEGAGWPELWYLDERLGRDLTGNPDWTQVDES